ncbi:MAG: flagellar basal-body rod protein FlgF [Lachnospiraceae bacterium]|nr:flagellar basal-body rod protein FlgF [Lachnospiraceae bacterium]
MVRGLYTAYTGMLNQQNRLDTITNNLANSSTTGYKREGTTVQAFDDMFMTKLKDGSEGYVDRRVGTVSLGVKIGENYTDYSQGSVRITDAPFDLAIGGKGFFTISYTNKLGQDYTMYTRDGSFALTKEGNLVTKDGDFVQGANGNIVLSTTADIKIDENGNIYEDGTIVDKLLITDFEDYNYLEKFGENLYRPVDGAETKDGDYTIQQGFLEMSNVNVISEMVEMIAITRNYEANQKMIQSTDSTLEQTVKLGAL